MIFKDTEHGSHNVAEYIVKEARENGWANKGFRSYNKESNGKQRSEMQCLSLWIWFLYHNIVHTKNTVI